MMIMSNCSTSDRPVENKPKVSRNVKLNQKGKRHDGDKDICIMQLHLKF